MLQQALKANKHRTTKRNPKLKKGTTKRDEQHKLCNRRRRLSSLIDVTFCCSPDLPAFHGRGRHLPRTSQVRDDECGTNFTNFTAGFVRVYPCREFSCLHKTDEHWINCCDNWIDGSVCAFRLVVETNQSGRVSSQAE